MAKIYDTLHPKNSLDDELFPNIEPKYNIPNNSIEGSKIVNGTITADKLSGGDFETTINNWLDTHPEATTTVEDGVVTPEKTTFVTRGNLINKLLCLKDKYLGGGTGGNIFDENPPTGNGFILTNVINVKNGDIINFGSSFNRTARIFLANANGVITMNQVVTDGTYTIPNDIHYLRLAITYGNNQAIYQSVLNTSIALKNKSLPLNYPTTIYSYDDLYIDNLKITFPEVISGWNNKKCAVLGTSLTANGGWTDLVKIRLGLSKLYNRGEGGTTLANFTGYGLTDYAGGKNIYTDIENYDESRTSVFCDDPSTATRPYQYRTGSWYSNDTRINLIPTDVDLVLVDLCTNDFYRSFNKDYITQNEFTSDTVIKTPYGESISAYEYNDKHYQDAFMLMIKRIQNRCPNAKIVVWGMLYNSTIRTEGDSMDYYLELIELTKKMCKITGTYFIDTMAEMGVNVFNSLNIIQDGVHPYLPTYTNEIGKIRIADIIVNYLKLIAPNT